MRKNNFARWKDESSDIARRTPTAISKKLDVIASASLPSYFICIHVERTIVFREQRFVISWLKCQAEQPSNNEAWIAQASWCRFTIFLNHLRPSGGRENFNAEEKEIGWKQANVSIDPSQKSMRQHWLSLLLGHKARDWIRAFAKRWRSARV